MEDSKRSEDNDSDESLAESSYTNDTTDAVAGSQLADDEVDAVYGKFYRFIKNRVAILLVSAKKCSYADEHFSCKFYSFPFQ